ncbi:MAG TPA: hypothetical protein VJ878_01795 [Candidatus Izemoplasmatales bacterium]|nr:hypothetical protein [Candidatus Izemoplasmatales bacterium]
MVNQLIFQYIVQDTITVEGSNLVRAVGYIHPDQITTIRSDLDDNGTLDNHIFSLVYFNYEIFQTSV